MSNSIIKNGYIYVTGENQDGDDIYIFDKKYINNNYVSLSIGNNHIVAVDKSGCLWSYGGNNNYGSDTNDNCGVLGLGITCDELMCCPYFCMIPFCDVEFINVCCGGEFTIALDSNNQLWSWGCNQYGQLGLGNTEHNNYPTRVIEIPNDVAIITCGYSSFYVLDLLGNIWSCGSNFDGQLGLGDIEYVDKLTQIKSNNYFKNIYSSPSASFMVAVDCDNNVYFCGNDIRNLDTEYEDQIKSLTLFLENLIL